MLSRIQLLTSKPSSQQLLKFVNSHHQSQRLSLIITRRAFSGSHPPSTESAPETAQAATETQQNPTDKTASAKESQEDYNLDEVNQAATPQNDSTQPPKQGGDRKRFPKRDHASQRGASQEGGLFKKTLAEARLQRQEQEAAQEKLPTYDEMSGTKSYQLQQELFNLIKNKIGNADKDKVQRFYSKIHEQLRENNLNASQKLDNLIVKKIQALILEQREVDDKKLYDESIKRIEHQSTLKPATAPVEPEYIPLRFDSGDTQKRSPISKSDYEDFISQRLDQLQREALLDQGPKSLMTPASQSRDEDAVEEETPSAQEIESREEVDNYNQFLNQIKLRLLNQSQTSEEQSLFDFNRVSNDITKFNEILEAENFQRERDLLKAYTENDVDRFDEQYVNNSLSSWKIEKEVEEEFEDAWQSLTSDIYQTARDELKSQYDQARTLMKINQQLRLRLLHQTKQTKQILAQTLRQKDKLINRLEIFSKDLQSDVIPQRVFDFIQHDKQVQARAAFGGKFAKKKNLAKQYLERKFDHSSRDIEVFNNELSLLLSHYKQIDDKKLKKEFVEKIGYIVELLHKNQAQQNVQTKVRLFEYGVISKNNDYANQMIKQISTSQSDYPFSLIDSQILNQFFTHSIKTDNFNGLGHLMSYIEKYGVNIGGWNLSLFKRALDFYLNQNLNLNNVLIFNKFYTYFHQCRLRNELQLLDKPLSALSDGEKFELNSRVFNQSSLVDMRSLFGFLVKQLGTRQAIDPITKEDALWRIVDFFTKSGIAEIAQYGQNLYNTISDQDIALYLSNRVNDGKSFEKTTQILLRLKDSQNLHNQVIQVLKEHVAQSGNNQLPISYEPTKVRSTYNKLRASTKAGKIVLSEKNLEYFLYIFKSLQMLPEIIDVCENFDRLSGQSKESSVNNEIKNYYLSDSLLQMPSSEHYYELVKKAVYNNQEVSGSAGYITAMTKAHFKDGSVDHALRFFESEVQRLREVKEKREEFLVTLFDSVYGEVQTADSGMSYEEYKNRYLDMIQISNNCIKESFAVERLQRVVQDKNYEEIDTLFQLYIVQKQENIILSSLPDNLLSQITDGELTDEVLGALNQAQQEDLKLLRERKAALESKIDEKDVESINQLLHVMKDKKISLFDEMDDKSADEIQKIFNIKSKEEVDEILKRTSRVQQAVQSLRDESTDFLEQLHKQRQQNIRKAFTQNLDAMIAVKREVPDRNIDKVIENTYFRKRANPVYDYSNNQFELDQFNDHMLHQNPLEDEADPFNIVGEAHDQTIADLKEQLLNAVNKRKSKILNITLNIFNKIQDQQIKSIKLNTVEQINPDENLSPKEINESLQKFNIIFNDPRSPVYSAVQTIAQYKGDKGITPFSRIFRDLEDFVTNRIDLESLQREQRQLESLTSEVQKSQQTLKQMQQYLIKEQQEIIKDTTAGTEYTSWNSAKDRTLSENIEKRIRQMYEEFKAAGVNTKPEDYSREDKLRLMRDAFSFEFGSNFQFASNEAVFPSFYAQDLLIFGMENDIVEAVRLGEKMMSENGYTLSLDLQKAVKNYMVSNAEKYQRAIKKTGPIDNSSLYRRVKSRENGEAAPLIFNLDDPYWQNFLESNSRRTQQWRIPSHLAWNHKPLGISSEVVDVQRIRDTQQQMSKYI